MVHQDEITEMILLSAPLALGNAFDAHIAIPKGISNVLHW
jgi:hypothetical protein